MKYNVKQAVSGIQDQMDQGAKNKVLAQALGGLAGGFKIGADINQANKQFAKTSEALAGQEEYFKGLTNDPDKFTKMMANENLLKIRMLQLGLTPGTVGNVGQNYKDIFSGSLFEPLASIERAKIMAQGMMNRQRAQMGYQDYLQDTVLDQAAKNKDPFGLHGFSSVYKPFVDVMKRSGNLFDNFVQGSPGVGVDFNPYIEQDLQL